MAKFTTDECKCIATGYYSRGHLREILVDLLSQCGNIYNDLQGELLDTENWSLDRSEENEAITILNDYCVDCHFELVGSDLFLIPNNIISQ